MLNLKNFIKQEIKNPYTVNWKLYISILVVSGAGILFSCLYEGCMDDKIMSVISNLALGCFASAAVALWIEIANVREKNKKAGIVYQSIYSDLMYHIGDYVSCWARLCVVAYKDIDYHKEKHTWREWYELTRKRFYECDEQRQKQLMDFFVDQLAYSVKETKKSVEKILEQRYILEINDVFNHKMQTILEDYRFEFWAAELDLDRQKEKKNIEDFWRDFDAISGDIQNYIRNWADIRYYNYYRFMPNKFGNDTSETLNAIKRSNVD
jgi:hypothetical protein